MCRSIVRLRHGAVIHETADFESAARQYVRKVSGYREPSRANRAAFEAAVTAVAAATGTLMTALVIRSDVSG